MRRADTVCLLAALLLGCALESSDLDAFRETATGPQKLQAVLRDGTRNRALRAEAALRLVDLDRPDVDGRALLLAGLRATDAQGRRALAPTFSAGLLARMRTPAGVAPAKEAVRAKDLGVELLALLAPEDEEQLGIALLGWIGEDVERRADCGRFSLETIAAKVGGASALPSAESMRPGLAPRSLARLTKTVEAHADARMRTTAAAKIVEVERSYRVHPGSEGDLLTHALPALGRFADSAPARARLVEIAATSALSEAERTLALELLEGHTTANELAALAPIALDASAPLGLRERALARLGETRANATLPTLLALASERHHRTLRQPATELAIELGGERALNDIFRALPSHWNATYAKSEIEAYARRVQQLAPTPYLVALLGKRLYSPFWWVRVIGLRYLAERAHPLDATWRIRLQVDDKQEILGEGWPPKWTVGREALAALQAIAAR